jgi:hypothetical protein
VGGLDGAVDGVHEVAADRVEVDRIAEPDGEGGEDRLGVVAIGGA